MGLHSDKKDLPGYRSDLSEDSEHFPCKALAAGVAAIAMDITAKRSGERFSGEEAVAAYEERAMKLYNAFLEECGKRDCVDLLGFDPFRYDEYPEDIQEYIEQGDWMQKCCGYMKVIIKLLYPKR
jgi:hypothetical protein